MSTVHALETAIATCRDQPQQIHAILHTLLSLFEQQQAHLTTDDRIIVYDAVGSMAETMGSTLNDAAYIQLLMPPLMRRWARLSDADPYMFPVSECLHVLATALGDGFSPYAKPVWQRCSTMIESHRAQQRAAVAAAARGEETEYPDRVRLIRM